MGLADVLSHDPIAIELIRSHIEAARREARFWKRRYPHDDMEAMAMQALYLAAFTFKPGEMAFYNWFAWKMRGQISNLRKREKRRGFCILYFDPEFFDQHAFYR